MSSQLLPTAPLQQSALGDEVSQILRTAIITGHLAPGTRIVESAAAESLGVSRGPVRDALRTLEAEGLVVTRPRRGSFVANFTRHDVEEILSLRVELEGLAARWAAVRITDAALKELEHAHARIVDLGRDARGMIARDLEFHRLVVTLSGHSRLIDAWQRLEPQILYFRHQTRNFYVDSPGFAHRHDDAMRAFILRDAAAAEAAMRAHVRDVEVRLLSSWPAEPSDDTPSDSQAQ